MNEAVFIFAFPRDHLGFKVLSGAVFIGVGK